MSNLLSLLEHEHSRFAYSAFKCLLCVSLDLFDTVILLVKCVYFVDEI